MSWPSDGQPRFKVGSVTGVPITEATTGRGNGDGRIGSVWYVYDRAYCHRIVREFKGILGTRMVPHEVTDWERCADGWREITVTRMRRVPITAKGEAEALAARLEAEHAT